MFNGFYLNLQNTWKRRMLKKPKMISQKYAGYGYGRVTEPFYIDYGNTPNKNIENISQLDSRYMLGASTPIEYVSDLNKSEEGGNDSGF